MANPFVWQMVKEAVKDLGGKASNSDIKKYIKGKYGNVNETTINCTILTCSVNKESRINWPENSKPRIATSQYDFLYNTGRGQVELYDAAKHGNWEIKRMDDGKLKVCMLGDYEDGAISDGMGLGTQEQVTSDEAIGNSESLIFPLENHLRDFIAKNIGSINVDGKRLSLFVNDSDTVGIEYQTDIGRIDLLAVDEDGNFVVLELKVSKGADYALGQLLRYMGWVKSKLCKGSSVKGVIVAPEIDDRLKYAASMVKDVTLYRYQVSFSIEAVGLQS
ncbi:endonuclease NucS domain-containing protein [Cohnella sp. GbtcB17]|uniref:endonuclease NucS domain-containing protein n=1 Tax=Cohnella sp. GbtcB17 TaxID=2824762 RepID=UPI001C2FB465|nr:endonuclease NucS domain-containing protein [Cohnella sp. GbtcB17]